MRLKGEEYSRRLKAYSDDTIRLLSEIMCLPKELYYRGRDITTNSELNEEQVVEALKALLAEYEAHSSSRSISSKT